MPQGTMGIPRLLDFDLVLGIHTATMSVFGGGAGRGVVGVGVGGG